MGYNNQVAGTQNRILVDNVVVKGNGGWILKKSFQGEAQGDLVIGSYRINLNSLHLIKEDFDAAVQYIGSPIPLPNPEETTTATSLTTNGP